MLWPTAVDYTQAVGGFPQVCLLDPKLKGGTPKRGPTKDLLVYSGGFSTVFPIEKPPNIYALRCWTRDIGDSKSRYEKIATYLKQVRLPYFVDFEYVLEGILIDGKKYPITRMEWVEGESLRDFIGQNLQNPTLFRTVADKFQKMVADLHAKQIAHGDLQYGNILITQNGTDIELKLIDYDSLFVPDLRGQPSPTPGLPEYQHPARGSLSNEKVDYFSELVIYLSFLSLSEKPELWKGKTERGLVFSKEDFENPNQSAVFQELENLSPDVQQLAATLKEFCAKTSIDQLEPLEAIVPKPDPDTHTDRGDTLRKAKQYDKALIEYQRAIALEPTHENARTGIGLVYIHQKRYADAINIFEQLIADNPTAKELHHQLGLAYFGFGDNSRATAAANEALKIDPHYQPAHQLLDVIKNSTMPPPDPEPPEPGSSPDPPKPSVVASKPPVINWYAVIAGTLGLALVICFIWFLTKINALESRIQELNGLVYAKDEAITQMEWTIQELNASAVYAQYAAETQLNLPEGAKARLGKGSINEIAYSPDGELLAVASSIGIWLYDVETLEARALLTGHTGWVRSVAFSRDGRTVASGSSDDTVRLWDVATGELTKTLTGHTGVGSSVAFSPDGRTVASGSWDATVRLWDVATGELTKTLTGHTDSVNSVAFSRDGRTVASASRDNTVRLWNVGTGALTKTLTGYTASVLSVAFSRDGRTLASGGNDDTVRLWNVATGALTKTLTGHTGEVYSVAFSPDGRTVASGSWDGPVRLWDVATGELTKTLTGHTREVNSVAFSRDGRTVASGNWDNTVRLWNAATGRLTKILTGHTRGVRSVAFSRDGRTLASGNWDNTVRLWDVATGELTKTLTGHTASVLSVAFSRDGRTVASGGLDNTVRLWNAATGELTKTFTGHTSEVWSVAFSRDGRTVASGGLDNTVRLWDVATGTLTKTLTSDTASVLSVAFSRDGRTLASGGNDDTVRLWNVATGGLTKTLTGHTGWVRSVAFSRDGRTVASGSSDDTVRLWDVATGELTKTLTGHTGVVSSVAFSRDGRTLASGSWDGTVLLWDITPEPTHRLAPAEP